VPAGKCTLLARTGFYFPGRNADYLLRGRGRRRRAVRTTLTKEGQRRVPLALVELPNVMVDGRAFVVTGAHEAFVGRRRL